MATNPVSIRSLLFVQGGTANPKTGAGQRTAICFRALKRLGPVDVVILSDRERKGIANFFPEARSVHFVYSKRFTATPKRGLDWLLYNVMRFLWVKRLYSPEARVVSALTRILEPQHRVIFSRYAQPFCVSGIIGSTQHNVFVDIDDRDDQKFLTSSKAILGTGPLGQIFKRLVIPAVRRQLLKRLSSAQLLWYATLEDDMGVAGPEVALLPNVPFDVQLPAEQLPASANKDILFVGSFQHRPNQDGVRWFLRECWPKLAHKHHRAHFRIVGIGDWDALASEFSHLERVEYVGTVDDIASQYSSARLVISPVLEGGGSKIKVIEACAYERPIVVTTHSARGFGSDIQRLLPTAKDAREFVELCDNLLSDDARLDALGARLRNLQQQQFSQVANEAKIEQDIRRHVIV
jgi:glycosyltransferase involved in cell wall biosynthesis